MQNAVKGFRSVVNVTNLSLGEHIYIRPTFYRIFRKKSTEDFHSIPYSVALFSAMLLLYYAFLKEEGAFLLITINCIGFAIESVYLLMFMIYASKDAKVQLPTESLSLLYSGL